MGSKKACPFPVFEFNRLLLVASWPVVCVLGCWWYLEDSSRAGSADHHTLAKAAAQGCATALVLRVPL